MSARFSIFLAAAAGVVMLSCLLLGVLCARPMLLDWEVSSGVRDSTSPARCAGSCQPDRMKLRVQARKLLARASSEAEQRRFDRACECIERALRLGEELRNDRSCAGQHSRLAMHLDSLEALRQLLQRAELSEARVNRLLSILAAIDLSDSVSAAMAGEKVEGLRTFAALAKAEDSPRDCEGHPCSKAMRKTQLAVDEAYYIGAMDERVKASMPPCSESVVRNLDEEAVSGCPSYAGLSESMIPVMGMLISKQKKATSDLMDCRAQVRLLVQKRCGSAFAIGPSSIHNWPAGNPEH